MLWLPGLAELPCRLPRASPGAQEESLQEFSRTDLQSRSRHLEGSLVPC